MGSGSRTARPRAARGSAPRVPPGYSSLSLQPFGEHFGGEVQRELPQRHVARALEAVRHPGRDDDHVARPDVALLVARRVARTALLDHEYLRVGVAVQARAAPGVEVDEDDR